MHQAGQTLQSPSRSAQHLRFLHQWLGREGTCGGRLCEKTMRKKTVKRFPVPDRKRISNTHRWQTQWRRKRCLENRGVGLNTFIHSCTALRTAQKQWVTLSGLCVATGNHGYHGNPQLHHTVQKVMPGCTQKSEMFLFCMVVSIWLTCKSKGLDLDCTIILTELHADSVKQWQEVHVLHVYCVSRETADRQEMR